MTSDYNHGKILGKLEATEQILALIREIEPKYTEIKKLIIEERNAN